VGGTETGTKEGRKRQAIIKMIKGGDEVTIEDDKIYLNGRVGGVVYIVD
jgi:signal peptidase I